MSRFCYGSCEGWRHYGDPDPDGRASVAGDGPYRHAVWLSEPGSARAGSAQARRHGRRSFLLQGQTRRSFEGHLARWPGSMPVYQKTRERKVYLAIGCRRIGNDLSGAVELSVVRDRLAQTSRNPASDAGRIAAFTV